MCHECNDEEPKEEFSIEMIPEEDREDFLDFTCKQFGIVISPQ